MRLKEFSELLGKILKSDPEAEEAEIWAYGASGVKIHIQFVGYDKRHRPNRIKLED